MRAAVSLVTSGVSISLIWLLLVALLTGCQVANGGNSHINRDRLVEDMSRQLQRGAQVRYQAEYRVAGGLRATVGQRLSPAITSYGYPAGLLIVSESERIGCDVAVAPAKCEIRARSGAGSVETFAAATRKGLVAAPVVAELLRVTTQQPTAAVKGRDTTVAGLPASCLEIVNLTDAVASSFSACVTAEGVLASFSGEIDGVNVDQALEQLALRSPDSTMFAIPPDAQVEDLRQA